MISMRIQLMLLFAAIGMCFIPASLHAQDTLKSIVLGTDLFQHCGDQDVYLSDSQVENFEVTGNSQAILKSETAIIMKPGFRAGGLSEEGYALMKIVSACGEMVWTGTASSDWTDPENWESFGIPTSTDQVIIGETSNVPVYAENGGVGGLTLTGGDIILSSDMSISQSLELINGIVKVTDGFVLSLGEGLQVNGGSVDSYVEGTMKKVGNAAFEFPTGSKGFYKAIRVGSSSDSENSYIVSYHRKNPNRAIGGNLDGQLQYLTPLEYWKVEQDAGTQDVPWSLGWSTSDGYSNFLANETRVVGWDGSQWNDLGNQGLVGDENEGEITTSSAADLSQISYLSLGGVNPDMLPKSLEVSVLNLTEPVDGGFGTAQIEMTFGVGESRIRLNEQSFLTESEATSNWETSQSITDVENLLGSELDLTDEILDVLVGRKQMWLEPGIYDIEVEDASGDVVQTEIGFKTDPVFGAGANLLFEDGTIKLDPNGSGQGYTSIMSFIQPNDNGGLSVELAESQSQFSIGFRKDDMLDAEGYGHLEFAAVVENGVVRIWDEGLLSSDVTNLVVGEELRVDRVSGRYRLVKNGEVVYKSGEKSPEAIVPAISILAGIKPLIGIGVWYRGPKPKFSVDHFACRNPNSGQIVASFNTSSQNWGTGRTRWRVQGQTSILAEDVWQIGYPNQVLQPGFYEFSFEYSWFGLVNVWSPWHTIYIDHWVNWENQEETVNWPNDATLLRYDPAGLTNTSPLSINSGANSEQNSAPPNATEAVTSFSLGTFTNYVGAIGYTSSQEGPTSNWQEIDFGVGTIGDPSFNQVIHIFLNDGNGYSGIELTPNNVEFHLEWLPNGTNGNFRFGWTNGGGYNPASLNEVRTFGQVGVTPSSWVIDASTLAAFGGYVNVHTSFPCSQVEYDGRPCAILRKKLDGGYHWVMDGNLRFQFDEEYVDGGLSSNEELYYRVLDSDNQEVAGQSTSLIGVISDGGLKSYGDNRFQLNLNNIVSNGMYVLEVTSEKNERFYLRFKKGV